VNSKHLRADRNACERSDASVSRSCSQVLLRSLGCPKQHYVPAKDHESKSVHIAYVKASVLREPLHVGGRWIREDPTHRIDEPCTVTHQSLAVLCPLQTCQSLDRSRGKEGLPLPDNNGRSGECNLGKVASPLAGGGVEPQKLGTRLARRPRNPTNQAPRRCG
jgi:hypothetical protein